MSAGLAMAAILLIAPLVRADQRTLFPTQDNTLFEDAAGSASNGAGPGLFVGQTHAAPVRSVRRALLHFDIAAILPAGAQVDSVWLLMTLTRTIDPNPTTVTLHKVQANWGEGTSNSGGGKLGGGGGAPAATGDATWLHRFFSTQTWTMPGGDYEPAPSGQAVIGNATAIGQRFTWASQPGMIADVQAWLDVPATNFGWILIGDETVTPGVPTARRLASREAPIEADRPQLVVAYSGVGIEPRTWSRVKALFRGTTR